MNGSGNQPHKQNERGKIEGKTSEVKEKPKEKSWILTNGKEHGKGGPGRSLFKTLSDQIQEKPTQVESDNSGGKDCQNKTKALQSKKVENPNALPKTKLDDNKYQRFLLHNSKQRPKKKKISTRWIPTAEAWAQGKSKQASFLLWNMNSGSESHRLIAEKRLIEERIDVAVFPEGQWTKRDQYQHRRQYRLLSTHGTGSGVSVLIHRKTGTISRSETTDPNGKWSVLEVVHFSFC
eukprot:GHVP01018569.1.p1 GENE.GHVP01018569.1~~GHVP01018569.1.p1  ORF type:complete len:258 (-),score=39.19 GHVP01018569.1:198-902(-)